MNSLLIKTFLLDVASHSLVVLLFVSSLLAFVFGIGLLLRQNWVSNLNASVNKWISTQTFHVALDRHRDTQRHIYRRHRTVGLLVTVGSAFVLWMMLVRFHPDPLVMVRTSVVMRIFLETLWWIIVPTNVVALLVGLVLIARPSLLRSIEIVANRQYSTDAIVRALDSVYGMPDRLAQSYPRLLGALIVAGSAYAGVLLGMRLLHIG